MTALASRPSRTASAARSTAFRYRSTGPSGTTSNEAAFGVGGRRTGISGMASTSSVPVTVTVRRPAPSSRTTTAGTTRSHGAPGENGTAPKASGPEQPVLRSSCGIAASRSTAESMLTRPATPQPAKPRPSRTKRTPSSPAISTREAIAASPSGRSKVTERNRSTVSPGSRSSAASDHHSVDGGRRRRTHGRGASRRVRREAGDRRRSEAGSGRRHRRRAAGR